MCFVTEIDLGAPFAGGGMVNDLKTLHCLRKLGEVDVIYLQKLKYVPVMLALLVFILQILQSISKHYKVYFSRSLIASAMLSVLRPFSKSKIVHQALSVPFPSKEVKYLGQGRFESLIRYSLARFLEGKVLRNVDAVTVAAPEYAEELIGFGVRRDKVQVVPFYVEDEFYEQPLRRNPKGTFVFCYVGAFHAYHNLKFLVKAFEIFQQSNSNIILLLVGNGPTRQNVRSEVVRKKLTDKIKFLGSVSHLSLPSILSQADVFVRCDRKPGLSIAVLEAAAAGKAIITVTREQGDALQRYFSHSKDVYMLVSSSPRQIARAMELLYLDSNLRNSIAEEARKTAQRYFSENLTFQSLRNLLAKL